MREILVVYESSLTDGSSNFDGGTAQKVSSEGVEKEKTKTKEDAAAEGFREILDDMVHPALEMCAVASVEKHRLRSNWDYIVFTINVMTYLQVRVLLRPRSGCRRLRR